MARRFLLLTVAAASLAWLPYASLAEESKETPAPDPKSADAPEAGMRPGKPARFDKARDHDLRDPLFREMRERFGKMPEEERQKLVDRVRKWQQMPGDEQAHIRFMQEEREKRAKQAVDDTIQCSGLTLDNAQKQKFTEIYKRERHKLEEELRAEMDKRRQERLPEMQKAIVEAYQKESSAATEAAAASPSPSPTPTAP